MKKDRCYTEDVRTHIPKLSTETLKAQVGKYNRATRNTPPHVDGLEGVDSLAAFFTTILVD